jgi:hypothetical protein
VKLIRHPTTFLFLGCIGAAVALIATEGCHTPIVVKDAGQIVEHCAAPTVKDISLHILDDVASALVSTDYTGGLVAIVTKFMIGVGKAEYEREEDNAWQAVKCAVLEVRAQAGVHLAYGIKDQPTVVRESKVLTNADAWLAAH